MDRNDWIDKNSIRINTLRSVYPGLSDEQLAKQYAVRMRAHVAVRYKLKSASKFTHIAVFSSQSGVDVCLGNPYCRDAKVLFDDGMAPPGQEIYFPQKPGPSSSQIAVSRMEPKLTEGRAGSDPWANCPPTPTLRTLKSYPPEFYLELVKWAKITGGITIAQWRSIKWFAYISEGDWGPKPAKQKYLLHIIQKAVDNGFPGIEGVDISDLLAKKKAPSETKPEYRRHVVPNKPAVMELLFKRQRAKCMYCGKAKHEPNDLHLDHKIPVSLGGSNDLSNLQLLCGSCNSRKGKTKDDEFREKYKLPPSSQVTGPPSEVLPHSYFIEITKSA